MLHIPFDCAISNSVNIIPTMTILSLSQSRKIPHWP